MELSCFNRKMSALSKKMGFCLSCQAVIPDHRIKIYVFQRTPVGTPVSSLAQSHLRILHMLQVNEHLSSSIPLKHTAYSSTLSLETNDKTLTDKNENKEPRYLPFTFTAQCFLGLPRNFEAGCKVKGFDLQCGKERNNLV